MAQEYDILVSPRHWRLFATLDGALWLGVMVGGVAMYEVQRRLSDKELVRYRDEGEGFLDDLAYKVCKNTAADTDRVQLNEQ